MVVHAYGAGDVGCGVLPVPWVALRPDEEFGVGWKSGYGGFVTDFEFTEEGEFVSMGAWE